MRGKTEYITFSRGAMQGPGSITHRPPSAAPGAPAPLPNLVTLKPTVSSRQSQRPGIMVPAAALRTGQQRGPRQVTGSKRPADSASRPGGAQWEAAVQAAVVAETCLTRKVTLITCLIKQITQLTKKSQGSIQDCSSRFVELSRVRLHCLCSAANLANA